MIVENLKIFLTDVPLEKAMARQWPMIEEHSARLRPAELYPKWGSIQLWVAPGDSEMDVAYNRPHITFQQMFRMSRMLTVSVMWKLDLLVSCTMEAKKDSELREPQMEGLQSLS